MKKIDTVDAPSVIGPYSQGYIANGFVFTSGQLPIDPVTKAFKGLTIQEQTEQSCLNVQAVLEDAGCGLDKVVKTTCYLADISLFKEFNEVYAKYFISKPARSCFAVKSLPCGALVEIEAIAVLDKGEK